jgi:hypothetical protein
MYGNMCVARTKTLDYQQKQEATHMTIRYNITGKDRKALVTALAETLGQPSKYQGAPSMAYTVGDYTVDRAGTLSGPDHLDLELILHDLGFKAAECAYDESPTGCTYRAELSDPDNPDRMEVFGADDDEDALRQARLLATGEVALLELFELDSDYNPVREVEIPRTKIGLLHDASVVEANAEGILTVSVLREEIATEKLDNLARLVEAKAPLLKLALGVDELPIQLSETHVMFPWFPDTESKEVAFAYYSLVNALCKTAQEKTRVTAQPREDHPNPKFAMRTWLIALGLVGTEHKLLRKLMTAKLPGNGAFSKGYDPRKVEGGGGDE